MKRADWSWRGRLLLEGTFWSGTISLAFGIDESEFGAEALLLARAVINLLADRESHPAVPASEGRAVASIEIRGEMSITGLRQMGITAHVLILPGAAIDHNPLLCVLPPSARSAVGAGRVQRHGRANKSLQCLLVNLLALVEVDGTPGVAIEAGVEEA
jgi:hypothetical protein